MGPKVLFQVGYVISCPISEKKMTNMVIVVWVSILFSNLWIYLNNLTMGISLLAILKINGEQLLQIQDDGGFLKYV